MPIIYGYIYTAVVIPRSKRYTPQQGANTANNHDNFFFLLNTLTISGYYCRFVKKKNTFYIYFYPIRTLTNRYPSTVCIYICMSVHSNRRCPPVRALNAAASVSAAPSTAIIDPRGGRRARGGEARRAQLKYLLRVSKKKKTPNVFLYYYYLNSVY